MGYGKQPPLKQMQRLAAQANIDSWRSAQHIIAQVVDALANWSAVAKQLGVQKQTIDMIQQQLDKTKDSNHAHLTMR
jgi:serine/threonine-protein kinase HipA